MTTMVEEQAKKEIAPSRKREIEGAEATRAGHCFTPAVDILETNDAILLLADLPGVRPEDLSIDLRENTLTLTGNVRRAAGDAERSLILEYETGSYYRQFRLSNAIDQDRIDAKLSNGVLRLTLPKAEASRRRKIEIKTA